MSLKILQPVRDKAAADKAAANERAQKAAREQYEAMALEEEKKKAANYSDAADEVNEGLQTAAKRKAAEAAAKPPTPSFVAPSSIAASAPDSIPTGNEVAGPKWWTTDVFKVSAFLVLAGSALYLSSNPKWSFR